MKTPKPFDCVQMKWDIQRKQGEATAGMDEQERRRALMDRVSHDPVLGPFLRRLATGGPSSRADTVKA